MKMLESRLDGNGTEKAIRIGNRMRDARKDAGYTIRELADKMDISPTHLNRIEKGERLMDSVEKLILFCEICRVPIEDYLVLCGMDLSETDTPIRRAFPSIRTREEEEAIASFAKTITTKNLTSDNITQMLNAAIAFADFCDKQNQGSQE